jgi:hypothetical protein
MSQQDRVTEAIKTIISDMMDHVMQRVLIDDPFIVEKHRATKPIYAALVPDEIFKGSHFERRFVTPFGSVWEKLAQAVALQVHGNCQRNYSITQNIGQESLRRIQEVLNQLEHPKQLGFKVTPDWEKEIAYIKAGKGNPIPSTVVCDLFIDSQVDGMKYAFEIKGPLPNSDQTKVSKEKLLKLCAMDPPAIDFAYYALPYNPYGKKQDYQWSFPQRWFNMQQDSCVLIGDEFWDLVGGSGTYFSFIEQVNNLGQVYRQQIYREFLGIEIPDDFIDNILK